MSRRVALLAIVPALLCLIFVGGCSRTETLAQSEKPAQPPPPSSSPASIQFVDAWGMKGDGPGQLDEPSSIAAGALGDVFLADAGSHFVHKFHPQGTPLLSFQDDWIRTPQSIAIDRGGAIYTADAGRGGVSIFLPTGDRYKDLKLRIHPRPEDMLSVTVADDGLIFILDRNPGQVFVYSPSFRLTQTWRPFASSASRATSIAYAPDGYVYVLDSGDNKIGRFSEDGHPVSEIAVRRPGASRRLGDQFAVTNGSVFLMDGDGLTLHVFTSDGAPKLDFDLTPQLGHQHRFIPALAIGARRELFVLDSPGSRVLRYRFNF